MAIGIRDISELIISCYIVTFTILSHIIEISPWVFFMCEIFTSVSLCLLTYNQLDNIFPPILHRDSDYKKMRITKKDYFFYFLFIIIFFLLVFFILFLSVLYVINFSIPSGFFYLSLMRTMIYFCVIFYFLSESFNDFSGHAYCEYYASKNSKKIKKHFLPRTLTEEMMKIYEGEFFLM